MRNRSWMGIMLLVAAVALPAVVLASNNGKKIRRSQLPQAVQSALDTRYQGAKIKEIRKVQAQPGATNQMVWNGLNVSGQQMSHQQTGRAAQQQGGTGGAGMGTGGTSSGGTTGGTTGGTSQTGGTQSGGSSSRGGSSGGGSSSSGGSSSGGGSQSGAGSSSGGGSQSGGGSSMGGGSQQAGGGMQSMGGSPQAGSTIYIVSVDNNGQQMLTAFDEQGTVFEEDTMISLESAPAAVQSAIQQSSQSSLGSSSQRGSQSSEGSSSMGGSQSSQGNMKVRSVAKITKGSESPMYEVVTMDKSTPVHTLFDENGQVITTVRQDKGSKSSNSNSNSSY